MTKRIYLALAVALALIALVASGCGKQQAAETFFAGDPYGGKKLNPATMELLNDPLYHNVILPNELAKRVGMKHNLFVYFFSPTCPHCKEATPVMAPVAEEFGAEVKMYNVLEFEQGWKDYKIEGTPTLIHFVDGAEKGRIEGAVTADEFRRWFEEQTRPDEFSID